jgi:hypothetical protein
LEQQATSDICKSDIRGKEVMNNYDVCIAGRFGRYEESNVEDTEPATDTHNTNTHDIAITTDQIRELINELENLTSDQKQKFTAVLVRAFGNKTSIRGQAMTPIFINDFVVDHIFLISPQLLN